jgi:hypothetical protein
MKKLILLSLSFLITVLVFSQGTVGTPEQLQRFLRSKTIVMLESNPFLEYNLIMKSTIEKHWDLTEYEFDTYTKDRFNELRLDTTLSFLFLQKVNYENDKTRAQYQFLTVVLGGDYEFIVQMPDIAQVPISYVDVEEEEYIYELGVLIRFLQEHIKLTLNDPSLKKGNIINYYNKNMHSVKSKTLYVMADELGPKVSTLKKIKKVYPFDVKIVTNEEVQAAIDNRDENVILLHKVGPGPDNRKARCFKVLINAADAKLFYFDWHMINDKKPDGFLESDFKKLAKKELKEEKKQAKEDAKSK